MRKAVTIMGILFVLAVPLAAQAPGSSDQGDADLVPVLSVSGAGQARVDPDEATVRLGVTAQAPTARAVQDEVNRIAGAVLDAVKKVGIPAARIQTSGLSLGPIYSQGRPEAADPAPRIAGYQASNTVSIQVEDLTKVGPVIDAGLGAGANTLEGVVFGLRNDEAARSAALADAVSEARVKAEALAKALKVRLVEILEVTEGGVSVITPVRGKFAMAESLQMADTPVSSGQVGIDASVTVRYRIAPIPGTAP